MVIGEGPAHLLEVGGAAVDHRADHARVLGVERHHAAPTGVPLIAATIDHQKIARPDQAERMVQQRRIRPRNAQRHRGAGDPAVGDHGAQVRVHEAFMAKMADRRGLDLAQPLQLRRLDLPRHRSELKHHSTRCWAQGIRVRTRSTSVRSSRAAT